jgi:hypothetical protein
MKSLIHILILSVLCSSIVLPQDKIFKEVFPGKFTNERLQKVHNANVDVLQRTNYIDSLLLKFQNNTWQTALRNPQREFYEEEGFNAKDTRTTINKTLLGDGFLLIELFIQIWDGSAWVNYLKYSYTHDVNNNLTEELLQTWDGSAWVNHSKNLYTYDGNNNLTEELQQSGPALEDCWKYSYTYDGNNNLTEEIEQLFDGFVWENLERYSYTYDTNNIRTGELRQTGPVWSNVWQYSYTYDGNNNLTEAFRQAWNNSAWVNSVKYLNTYDGNNNQTEHLLQVWVGSDWVNDGKVSYTYDGNNNLTELVEQEWDGSDWVNFDKYSYTYDGNNNRTEELRQYCWNAVWLNIWKYSYTYDGSNNLTEWIWQDWDGSAWLNIWKRSYTYDGNNNLTEMLQKEWDGSEWVITTRLIYSYIPTDVTEFTGEVNDYSLSNNFPNPFNPSTKIKYSVPQTSEVEIKIFDILGNEIETLVDEEKPAGFYEVEFTAKDISSGISSKGGYASGVYFYRIAAGNFVQTKKMILLK